MAEGNKLGVVPDASIYSAIPEPQSAAQMMQGMNALALQKLQLDKGNLDLGQSRISAMHNAFSAIAADPRMETVQRQAQTLRLMGVPEDNIQNGLQEFARTGGDPAAIRDVTKRHLSIISPAHERVQMGFGTPYTEQQGDRIVSGTTNPFAPGVRRPGSVSTMGLSPSERTATQAETVAGGGTRAIPKSELYDREGNLLGAAPPARMRPAGPPAMGAAPAPRPVGRPPVAPPMAVDEGGMGPAAVLPPTRPGALGPSTAAAPAAAVPVQRPPVVVAAPVPVPVAPAGPRGFTTSLPPAEATANEASARDWSELRSDIDASRQRVLTLRQAKAALEGTTTGIGTDTRNKMQSFIQSVPGLPDSVKKGLAGDAGEISSFDLAKKYLTAYQFAQKGAGRSDAALGTAQAATPSTDTSPEALREMLPVLIGQEHERQARAYHYLASDPIQKNPNPAGYSNWNITEWGKRNDPKAYGVTDMTADQRRKYFEGLSPEGKAKFRASIRAGMDAGLITTRHLAGE